MMEGAQKAAHKPHRPKHSGPQADRKKKKTAAATDELQTAKQRNPRAFAIQSINKTARAFRRSADIKEKKHHIPVVDRSPLEPPPIVVAVVGPPKVGKTTLVRCLVKNFTHQNLAAINGPVTLVSGKKRRLTFIECNNDISSMIDVAKVADLVLLMVDASFGFEMETFEFLNIAQSHGFPKFMGVLTHLDGMRNNKALNKTKKRLKHRFWKEVYQGAKLFYLSGMLHGEYLRRETHNLGRFISVMKFRPLVWRTSHPYILADRMEDLTSPELIRQKEKCDRHISLYGYVRGTPLKLGSCIHLAGCGDFDIKDITFLPDPCPLPDKEKKRSLNTKERLIYAPMSGVGGIVYDKDVVYVELGNTRKKEPVQEPEKPSNELVSNLIGTQHTLDTKMATSRVTLFDGTTPVNAEEVHDEDRGRFTEETVEVDGRRRRKVKFDDEDVEASSSEEEDEDEGFEEVSEEPQSKAKREEAGLGPPSKKGKLDLSDIQFADSDDELELDAMKATRSAKRNVDPQRGHLEQSSNVAGGDSRERKPGNNKHKIDKEIGDDSDEDSDDDDDEMDSENGDDDIDDRIGDITGHQGRSKGQNVRANKKRHNLEKSGKKGNIDGSDDRNRDSSSEDDDDELESDDDSTGDTNDVRRNPNIHADKEASKIIKSKRKANQDDESESSDDDTGDDGRRSQGKPNRQKVQAGMKRSRDTKSHMGQNNVTNKGREEISSNSSSDDDDDDSDSSDDVSGVQGRPKKQELQADEESIGGTRSGGNSKEEEILDHSDDNDGDVVRKVQGKIVEKSRKGDKRDLIGNEKTMRSTNNREKIIEEEEFEDPSSEESGKEEDAGMQEEKEEEKVQESDGEPNQEMKGSDSGSDHEDGELRWKESLTEKAAAAFIRQQQNTPNLRKLVYGEVAEVSDEDKEELGGFLTVVKPPEDQLSRGKDGLDSSSFPVKHIRDWDLEEVRELIKDCFVTGNWDADEDAETLLQKDDELYGDFEDLETGEVHEGEADEEDDESSDDDVDKQDETPIGDKNKALSTQEQDKLERERQMEKKRKSKLNLLDDEEEGPSFFDEWKEEMNQQAKLNRAEFEDMDDHVRTQYEGFRPGMYVRVEVANVPYEFVANFDPSCPMVLGGLLSSENAIGFVQIRFKKHRWYPKIMKTRDPLIFSVGWRRFQTIPLYCIQDHNGRNRLLKYTPQHLHCIATIWGPITPQGTGVLAVQSLGRDPGFRIAATGVILDLDKSINIVKKLKLTGVPFKIHKNTAFIQGMFNSSLEVAKFEGALIRTVSGIRGQIKKSYKAPPGAFRASFEDKILRSDIVFLRSWYQVQLPKFYNPVTNLLLPKEAKWTGMRTVGQLRRDQNLQIPVNQDSLYKPIVRQQRRFAKMVIPRKLAGELPFKYRPQRLQKKGLTIAGTRAVIREPHERKIAALMQELGALYNNKKRKAKEVKAKKSLENKKRLKIEEEKLQSRQKRDKREMFRLLGQMKKDKSK